MISLKKGVGIIMVLQLFWFVNLRAQQEPLYTQYMFNTVSVNPAYTGTRNAMNILLLSRLQWVGIDGAPRTYNFTMHTPLNNYKMGVGFSIVSDSYGPVTNSYFNFNYAYRINVTDKVILSMGLKGGIYNYYVGLNDLNPGNTDESISGNYEKKVNPNVGAGLYLYSDKWYLGLSVPTLIETNLSQYSSSSGEMTDLERHYYLMGGYVLNMNKDFKFKPSAIYTAVEGSSMSLDVTALFLYKNAFWFGASYRFGDAVALIANVQLNRQLMVGYSYDVTTSELSSYSNGSHEIVVSYDFDRFVKKKVVTPRYF